MKKLIAGIFLIVICVVLGISAARILSNQQSVRQTINRVSHDAPTIPTATPTPAIETPQTLIIPKLNINSTVESLGLDAAGRMDVPKGVGNTGWFAPGPKPGEVGNAVIDGHFDTPTGAPSVFYYIGNLQVGDVVQVVDANNTTHTFHVTNVTSFPDNGFPISQVFGPSTERDLNLITCSGTWDKVAHNYSNRTVVFTTLADNKP